MIGYAKQTGNSVWLYDETGNPIFNKCGELIGYTNTTVSIKSNSGTVWTFDSSGRCLFGR